MTEKPGARVWQIWHESYELMECEGGYHAPGLLGGATGDSFEQACENWSSERESGNKIVKRSDGTLAWWIARVYPTEAEAVAVSAPYVPFDPNAKREWTPSELCFREIPKWIADAIGDSKFVTLQRKPFHVPEILWHGNDATGAVHEGDVNTYRVIR